jgi:hypothetical protein
MGLASLRQQRSPHAPFSVTGPGRAVRGPATKGERSSRRGSPEASPSPPSFSPPHGAHVDTSNVFPVATVSPRSHTPPTHRVALFAQLFVFSVRAEVLDAQFAA